MLDTRQKAAHQRSKQAIEKVFSPEFRNRLDAIVSFDPLTPAVMETIVEKFILQLEAQLAERSIAITLEPDARPWLAEKGYDPVYGARPLARVIQTDVRDPLTDEILFGRLEQGGTVTIRLEDGRLAFGFEARTPPVPVTRGIARANSPMTDKEHDIPVKVVDRRWWAREDDGSAPEPSGGSKPTYVEELERQLAEKDQASLRSTSRSTARRRAEFEESRLRLRARDLEGRRTGAPRDSGGSARRGRQPRSRARCRTASRRLRTRCCRASRWCSASSWASSRRSA